MNGGHFEFRTTGRTRSILKDQDKGSGEWNRPTGSYLDDDDYDDDEY
jgi:hypothetical protein